MGGYTVREQSLPESSRVQVRELLGRLCSEGLLCVVDDSDSDPINFRYTLTRPLSDISLCSLLDATDGTMQFSSDEKSIYDHYGMAGRKLGVANYMICHLLSQISLVEIILPEDCDMGNNDGEKTDEETKTRSTYK